MEKEQKMETTPGTTLRPKDDFAFLSSLPTLFNLEGNPSTLIDVIGMDGMDGKKYVKKKIILNNDNKQYAYNERTMMQVINSDYILKLLHWQELNQNPKKLALYMDFCEKGDLRTYLTIENPPIAKRIQFFIDVLYAMRFLHEKFIIHRDMKLQNILVTQFDQIKIADLGCISQTASLVESEVGTFAYQAPEVYLKKGGYTDKVDVWSVACLGFQILNKPFPEEIKRGILIRDPFMPASALLDKVNSIKGPKEVQYLKIFEQNPLVFVPKIPNSLKFLLGDMLVPDPQKRISFRQIYEGKYLPNLLKQLRQSPQFGHERVQAFKNLHILINEYPKIYHSLKGKQKRLTKHQELYDYLFYRLYNPLIEKLYTSESANLIAPEKSISMKILLFLAMRKMKTIYEEVKSQDFIVLKKKLQNNDKAVSKYFIQVKNSVEAYLRSQGQKGIEQNKELLDQDYFIKLMKLHAKDIKINAASIIE